MNVKTPFWVSKILKYCLLLFSSLLVLGIVNYIFFIYKNQGIEKGVLLILCFALTFVLVLFFCYLLAKIPDNEKSNKLTLLTLLIVFMLISYLWIYLTPSYQTSDYNKFWCTTVQALNGRAIYKTDNNYFAKWAYQTGFLTYLMLIVKVFGAHIRVLQLLNIIYQVIILILLYCLTQKLFQKVVFSRWCVFLMEINLEWFCLNNRLSNQYIALMFFLLALYMIINNHSYKNWILAAISLAIGNFFRPLGIIYFAAIIVFSLIYYIIANAKRGKRNFFRLLTFIATYFLLLAGLNWSIQVSGLNEYGLSNHDSSWKFVTGLNYQSSGTYRRFIDKKFDLNVKRQEMQKQEEKVTRENIQYLNHNHLWLKLFIHKFNCLWSYPSNSLDYTLFGRKFGQVTYELLLVAAYAVNSVEMIFMLIGAFAVLNKKMPYRAYLLLLTLFAYAAVQLLIEVQGRYRIEFTPILVIFSLLGIQKVFTEIDMKRRNYEPR